MKYWYRDDNDIVSHGKTCRKLKHILPSKRSQSERAVLLWFWLYDILEKLKLWRLYKDQLLPELGRVEQGVGMI